MRVRGRLLETFCPTSRQVTSRVGDVEGAKFTKDDKNQSLVSVIASDHANLSLWPST